MDDDTGPLRTSWHRWLVPGLLLLCVVLFLSGGPRLSAAGQAGAMHPSSEASAGDDSAAPSTGTFSADTPLTDVAEQLGCPLEHASGQTLGAWLEAVKKGPFAKGESLEIPGLALTVLEVADGRIARVRVSVLPGHWREVLPLGVITAVVMLLGFSAFFSGSETAFFSIHKLRLRAMNEEKGWIGRMVAKTMEHPSRLLATILLGNMIVNVLVGILLGTRVEDALHLFAGLPSAAAYVLAVALCTGALFIFGEVTPKIFAVRMGERIARLTVLPLRVADRLLAPVRDGVLRLTDALFAVVHFHDLHAAPFITDEELKTVFSNGEARGVIEEDERQMIRGILEFRDALLREILVPRPDVVAIQETATVRTALEILRENEYSRMPVYADDLDHVTGLLVAKDLLPSFAKGDLEEPVRTFVRPAHFVPETMTIQQFVNEAQRRRTHLAIVVDEYGGTAGIVALEDALEEVVGEIMDEDEQEEPGCEQIEPDVYRVEGGFPLDELNAALDAELEDDEHETVAGFMMKQIDKVPEPGDQVTHRGIRFTVEACDGKRVETLRVQVLPEARTMREEGP